MSNAVVLATAPLDDYATGVLSAFGQFRVTPDIKESTLAGMMDGVVALAVRGAAPITEAVLANAPALRVIGRTGVGYDSIDIAAATRRGIPVVYAPGAGAPAVAEATFAFMLALCKQVMHWDRELKAGNWNSRLGVQGGDLDGKVIGIIGLGRIGRLVAGIAKVFNMTVMATDPYVDAATCAAHGARKVELEELLSTADFISLHCPQNTETRGMIDRARLAVVKPGAFLVNLARGGVIDGLDPIHEALASGRLAGAAIDVFDPSPPDVTHPLFQMPNCLTSPHAMATTAGAMTRIFKSMADDMAAILGGAAPRFVVNPEVLDR